ncbi:tenascin-X isoform X2 [Eublepharis macularius]|uniref:Tenascin-X isoform X2 n=1 Tax=Eublepharis macularius TaxID=481883 RepID=A0AA97JCC7_EUBMA|nr:tenascin-X isoform X2 [Eublepharis macularius]
MGRMPTAIPFQLLILCLAASRAARVPHPAIPSNATIFSHVYTIKLAGDSTEGEDEDATLVPQEALGPPGTSRGGGLYEHTLEGSDQEHVVFTHRINLPLQSCGCSPGTEDTQQLLRRLQALENEVRELRDTCQAGGGCCSASANIQASTGQTDTRTLCSHHGSFDLSRCLCDCEPGWGGPTCAQPACPGGCGGPQRGKCVDGRCQCRSGYSGIRCEEPPSCPDDCNDQGRCVDGHCSCFPGYIGPSCADPACPQGCQGHGQCVSGRCICDPGYSGPDCGTRACPSNCNRRGECRDGRCVCEPGFTGPACGTKSCPNDCNQRGRCLKGGVCSCHKGYTGSDCGQLACPEDCSGHGDCQQGVCQCHDGYSGDDCSIEIPSIGVRVSSRDETSFRLEWSRPEISVDGYEIHVASKNHQAGESIRLSSTETTFERTGLKSGEDYTVTIRAEKGQRYGPPVTQTVRTRVAPPRGLQPSGATEDTLTLHWDPPTTRPDSYILSYMPLVATRPSQPPKRLELPAVPESVTLGDLESRTRYRITLIARQSGESSRPASITASTTVPVPSRVIHLYATSSPSSQLNPGTVSSGPEARKPGHKPHTSHPLSSTTSLANELSLRMMVQNFSATLSLFNGTLLERLESYLRTTKYPLRNNQTIKSVAQAIYIYIIHRKPREFQDMIYERLVEETNPPIQTNGFQGQSVFSNGYTRPDHTRPAVVASSPDSIEVSLDGVTMLSDEVFIHYQKPGSQERGELVVPGGTPTAVITGLIPGTKYYVEIHGVVKGRSSKSYSFVTTTAPDPFLTDKIPSTPGPNTITAMPLSDLNVTDVSPNSLRVIWSSPPNTFSTFSLQYRDPKSNTAPGEIKVPGTERSVNVMGLNPATEYDLELHGERPDGIHSAPLITKASTAPAVLPSERGKPNLGTLSVSEVTDNFAHLLWDSPTGTFNSFLIQYKDAEGKLKAVPVDASSREATISDLVPSQKYKFNLYGFIGRKRHGPVSTETTTAPVASEERQEKELLTPPSLGELIASEITKDSVRLSWRVPTGNFDSFVIQFKDAEGRSQVLPVEGAFREVTVPSLAPSRRYRFNLYGIADRKRLGPVSKDVTTASWVEEPLPLPEPVLGDLLVSDATSNSVRLSWTVPTGTFDSFLIQYQDPEGNSQALPVGRDSLEVTVPNLVPSQRYKFDLYGISGPQRLGPVSADATTAPSQGTKVFQPSLGELSASDATSNSVRLSWTVPTGRFNSFQVQFKDAEGKPQALPVEGSSRQVTVPNLSPSRKYKFNLYGIFERKRYGPISTEALTAPATASREERVPVEPSLGELLVSDVTSDSAVLSWTVPTGSFDSFLVQFKDTEGKLQVLPVDGGFHKVTISNLAPSHRYKFNLYGVSGRKRSGPVSTDATTAATATSPKVTTERVTIQLSLEQLTASDITSDSLRLSWIVPTGNFDSFLVQYRDAEGKLQSLPAEGAFRTLVIPNLEPSQRYKFNLYGISGNKRLGPLSVDAVTASQMEKPTPPLRLGELSADNIMPSSLDLSWNVEAGNFDSFIIQYRDAEDQTQALPIDGVLRSFHVHDLVPSHSYKFNLYGISGRKRLGPVSIEALTAPEPTVPPAQPSLGELSVSDVTSDSARLSWTVPMGSFDSFVIQYKDAEGKPQALPVEGVFREVTVPSLVPSSRYKFNLYGISGRKRIGPISTDAVTAPIPTTPPAKPSLGELSVFDVTSDSARLSWTVPTGSFDSFLIQYKDAEGKLQALPVEGNSHEATVPNLAPSRRYKFNLYGVSGRKRLGPISADTITAPEPTVPPAQPSLGDLSVSDVTSDSVRLSWTVPMGSFDSFLIQYKDAEGKPQALPVEGDSREATVPNLAPSRRYKFNLYGVSGRKRLGPISADTITAPIPTTPPAKPSLGELSVFDVTSDSARLSWTVPTGSFDSFLIQYKDAEGKPQALPEEGDSREATVPNLAPSRRYKFNLYGVSGRKRLGPISTDTVTAPEPTAPPAQPSLGDLSVSDVTSDSARLSWTVPMGSFDSFVIQYKDAEGKPQALPVEGVIREVTVPSLVPSRRYKFNLYGISGRKRIGPISTDAVTAPEPTAPPAQPSLGELSVSDVTSDSALLSWTVPTGSFDSFVIQYKDAEGKPQALPVEGVFREVTVPSLVPSRRYKFNLYGISGRKRIGPISTDAVTAPEPTASPAQPSLGELSVSDVTSDSARLSWIVPTGSFDSFMIQYKDAEGKPQSLPVEGVFREVTVPNLVPSRQYKFHLYGILGRKRHGPISADAVTAPLPTEPPAQPSLEEFTVSDVTSDSARLSWTVPTGSFDSFLVQYKDAEGQSQALPADGSSREVTVPNLAPSRQYKFNLYGVSGHKRFGPVSTDAMTAPSPTTPPPQPSLGELSVSDVTSDSARLSWTVPTGSFDSFMIQYKNADGKPQALPVEGDSREITVPNLAPSRRYKFNLYGVSGQKRLGPVSVDTVTASSPQEPPVPPSLGELSASDITSHSLRLSWTVPVGGFDSFLVQYKDAEGKPQALPVEGASREFTIQNLVPSRRYKFNLYGLSGRKRFGPVSTDALTAPVEEKSAPPSLGDLSISDVTSNSTHLTWTVPTGNFDSFLVQYKDAEGRPQALPLDGSTRQTTISGLSPSRRYKFNLYGISGRKRLGPISADTVTAPLERDDAGKPSLGELSVSDVTSNSVHLSWTVPTGSFDSFLIQYKDAEGKPQTLPMEGGSREVTVPNLAPSRRYKFNLYGVSGRKRLGPVSAEATTAAADQEEEKTKKEEEEEEVQEEKEEQEDGGRPQPSLGELSVSEATSDSVHLSWSVPTGNFDSFLIQYRDTENNLRDLTMEGDSLETIVPNLTPSHSYRFELYGIFSHERFGPIAVDASTAPLEAEEGTVTPHPQPNLGELSVSDITTNSVRLFWSIPIGIFDSFLVQYKDAEGKPQSLPVGKEISSVVIYYLVPSYRYKFNLYGISGRKRFGPVSVTVATATTEPQEDVEVVQQGGMEEVTPGTEQRLGNLSVSEVTSHTARLLWSVPTGSFDSFSVQYKDAEGRPQAIPVGGGSYEVIVPNLVPSHKYRFNLYGISGHKRLGPISVSAVTAAKAPEQEVEEQPEKTADKSVQPSLGDVTVSEVTPDSLLLSWSIQEGHFDSFLIQYKDAARKLQVLPVDGAMRSLHLYNLSPLQRYEFSIYGIYGNKRLGPVSVVAVTAPEVSQEKAHVQPRLEDLSVSKVTSDSVSLSWTVPAGSFDSILVQYRDAKGKPQVLPLNGDSRDVTVSNLASSHRYKFNLYGVYGRKRLGPISIDAVTGPGTQSEEAAPLRLGELLAGDITPESLLLSWTVEDGNFDSFIIQYYDAEGKPHALPVDGGLRSLRLHDMTPSHKYRFNLYGVSGRKRFGPIFTEAITAPAPSGQVAPLQPSLGEISASDVTGTSVHLSWSVASGKFDSFIIQYRDMDGKPQTLPVNGNSRDVTISNLVPSRRYKFNLYGIAGRKRLGPISTEAITARMEEPEKHPKLGDLSISEVTNDSVRLSWTISFGKFESFLIQYKDANGRHQTLPIDADSRTFVVSGLLPSHKYKFNLYGISGRKQIGPISTDAVTAFPEAIKPLTLLKNLIVFDKTPTTLLLMWEAPEGLCDSFRIRYKDSLVGSGKSPLPAKEVEVPGAERSAVLRGLAPNKEYSLTLYGIKNGSEVASINTAARTSGLELDSPRDLRFSDIRETSVVANWREPSSRIDRYKVSFQPSDGGEPRSISVDGSKLRTIIGGLIPGTSYEVSVMSIRGFEESEPLVGYVTTVPDGPSNLRAVNVTDSSAVLTWQPAVAEMNNYIVTYGPAGGSRVSESVPGNRAELRLTGLRLDTEYRASVYGEKEGNRSSPVSATFTTGADGPRNLQATEISPRSARLTWLPPRAPPGGYLLSYETPYGQTKEITVDASVTSYELQDLFPSSRYQVQVQALRRGMPTAPTSTSFTTGHLTYPFPRDCAEESWNGPGPSRETTIYLGGNRNRPIQGYCDMETDGGGWLVFQRRMNGKTDFWRDWQDYATGFGNRSQEFWLGNDALHQMTTSGDYELRVDLRAGDESVYAVYDSFRVDSPADYYRLHLGSYSGTAGDAFSYHSGSVFSTRDRDPNRVIIPCAVSYRGAWWYHNCHYANLNGLYANNRDHQGINWFNWKGFEFSIPFTEMKLRPHSFRPLRRV